MSGADLHLEDAYLERLRSGYAQARDIFGSVAAGAHGVPGTVGDATLASRARDFFEGWDKRRHELIDSLEGLRDAVETIETSFSAIDDQWATSADELGTTAP